MDAEMMGDGWSMELIERDHKIFLRYCFPPRNVVTSSFVNMES